jgi:predicted GIY-YIG superfamily endonuclease
MKIIKIRKKTIEKAINVEAGILERERKRKNELITTYQNGRQDTITEHISVLKMITVFFWFCF